jgi:outer membrane usher protein
MYPASMRGYAPVIRGTAGSSAEVSIRQNGHEIYRINVAPGAFVIDDLPLLSSGGDLEVMITEADGQGRMFTVPYSSVPLQREGICVMALPPLAIAMSAPAMTTRCLCRPLSCGECRIT